MLDLERKHDKQIIMVYFTSVLKIASDPSE